MKIVKKVLILLLVFTVLFNTILLPVHKSNAFGLTLGFLYGLTVGEAVLGFILSSAAVGVTYATLAEAKKAYDVREAIRFEELMMIPSVDPRPPGEPEPPGEPPKNWRDQMNKILKGTAYSGLGLVLLYNLKEWYLGLGVEEGENQILETSELVVQIVNAVDYSNQSDITIHSHSAIVIYPDGIWSSANIKQEYGKWGEYYNTKTTISGSFSIGTEESTGFEIGKRDSLRFIRSVYDNKIHLRVQAGNARITSKPINRNEIGNQPPYEVETPDILFNLVYDGGSAGEIKYPQPNLDVIPKERIETIILPNGTTQKVYKGSQEEMLEDIVNNTTIENVYNNTNNYTTINEGDTVIINEGSTTTPYPTPTPGETPSTPVEPGSQLDYTTWFQSIINWLSNIFNEIKNIPNKILDGLATLFIPQPNYLNSKLDILQTKVNTKLNLPDLTPLPAIFDGIGCEPIPDGYIGDNKVFDASYINNLALTIANWQRFLWWIVLILIGANNGYKLIRGTDLITIKGPHGGGWSSKGG